MKKIKIILVLISIFSVKIIFAQQPRKYYPIDSTDFSKPHSAIYIHPRIDNLWQHCTPDKSFFNTTGYAMVTDSINNYTASDTSIFELRFNNYNWSSGSFYIDIIHKYDFDVYNAGGIISFSIDSGETWFNAKTLSSFGSNEICERGNHFNFQNLYTNSDSLSDGTPCFTGSITEWKKIHAELQFIIPVSIYPMDCNRLKSVWTRFTFISLPTAQQDNGWAVKELKWGSFSIGGSVKEMSLSKNINFQNPVQNKLVINTNGDENYTDVLITDISGKEILKTNYLKEISVEDLQSGLYFLYLTERNKKTVYSKFIKE